MIKSIPSLFIADKKRNFELNVVNDIYKETPEHTKLVQNILEHSQQNRSTKKWSANEKEVLLLNICTRHGVQWENGTRNIFESSDMDTIESVDVSTSLYLFMVAAVDDKKYSYDLDSVFHLIKSTPKLVCVHQCTRVTDEEGESLSRKQKRSS